MGQIADCGAPQMRYRRDFRMPRFVIPALFVVLWSTGFLGARLGLPYCEPLHFLALRFVIVAALLLAATLVRRVAWPPAQDLGWVVLVGLLLHGVCLGGYFTAMNSALPLGVVALIGSLQPVLTAMASRVFFGERLRTVQWLGIALGVAGVALVASGKFGGGHVQSEGLLACFIGVIGITAGTLVQKRRGGHADFRTMGVIQYAAAAIAIGLASLGPGIATRRLDRPVHLRAVLARRRQFHHLDRAALRHGPPQLGQPGQQSVLPDAIGHRRVCVPAFSRAAQPADDRRHRHVRPRRLPDGERRRARDTPSRPRRKCSCSSRAYGTGFGW